MLVTWTYTPHEAPRKQIVITESVYDFIAKLVRHIPDQGFHVLRYYGFYANRSSYSLTKKKKLFDKLELAKSKTSNKWRIMIKNTYKYDPLLCPCGQVMILNLDMSYLGKYE
ncbi:transposase [Haploplasma modicum]|uniref:transposase n=1 Tax=Haploplasma modicum TaxID=2150 RepID=UPI00138AB1E0